MFTQTARPRLWWGGEGLYVVSEPWQFNARQQWRMARLAYVFHPISGESMSGDFSSALRLVTPPAAEPVTLSQAKAFLRIEHAGDDAAVTRAIATARVAAEQYLRLALLAQTWELSIGNLHKRSLALPVRPVTSITSVTLMDTVGNSSVVSSGLYQLSVAGDALLFSQPVSGEVMKVQFVAGAYANAAAIPAPMVQGMLHHVAAMMESREGAIGLPMQSVACYAPYRQVTL